MTTATSAVLRGEARGPAGEVVPATITLGTDGFSIALGPNPPWGASYRDIATVAESGTAVVIELGAVGGERWSFERFGPAAVALARRLRDGRFRQWLTDGLVEIPGDAEIDVVEVGLPTDSGPAQLLYHDRGVAIAPLDEGRATLRIRRADIETVAAAPERGGLHVETRIGPVDLIRLGAAATSHERRWSVIRDSAAADIGAMLEALVPDAPFDVRRRAGAILREGRPADAAALGAAWDPLERAVLAEPTFAASYGELLTRAGGATARRWLVMAPESPGAPERPRIWFLVGLPGNLVALELVSEGAHATYLFRVAPRAGFVAGSEDRAALELAVGEVSDALLDSRFLRELLALPEARLGEPEHLRYRLALRVLPSVAAARARFVARLVHRDPAGWAAALDDVVAWHGAARDEAADWPGRAGAEAEISESPGAGSADGTPPTD
jgi:hypothetical protein